MMERSEHNSAAREPPARQAERKTCPGDPVATSAAGSWCESATWVTSAGTAKRAGCTRDATRCH